MWKIINITQNGDQRTDGEYPLRVGCAGDFLIFKIGFPILFSYRMDASGNKKDGMLRTSTVTRIVSERDWYEATTLNSIYTFRKLVK